MKFAVVAAVVLLASTVHAGVDIDEVTSALRGPNKDVPTSRPDISGVYLDYSNSYNWIAVKSDGKSVIGIGSDDQRHYFVSNGEVTDAEAKTFKLKFPEGTFTFMATDNSLQGQGRWRQLSWNYQKEFRQYGGPLGGVSGPYVDYKHHKDGDKSFAGRRNVHVGGKNINIVGTDDGVQFWHVAGEMVAGSSTDFTVDFSSKGGPKSLEGSFKKTKKTVVINWADGNQWSGHHKYP